MIGFVGHYKLLQISNDVFSTFSDDVITFVYSPAFSDDEANLLLLIAAF